MHRYNDTAKYGNSETGQPMAQEKNNESGEVFGAGTNQDTNSWMFAGTEENVAPPVSMEPTDIDLGMPQMPTLASESAVEDPVETNEPENVENISIGVASQDVPTPPAFDAQPDSAAISQPTAQITAPHFVEEEKPRKKPGRKPKAETAMTIEHKVKKTSPMVKEKEVAKTEKVCDASNPSEHDEIYWLKIIEDNPQLHYYQAEIIRLVGTRKELPRAAELVLRLIEVR